MVINDIKFEDTFVKDSEKLPFFAKKKLSKLIPLLAQDAFDPRLHSKALNPPLESVFSFRITRDWRVGFVFTGPNKIELLVADRRDSIYSRLKRILGR